MFSIKIIPKIERVTRNVTISHFFLMFGYKLFSLYFPLFLVARGMTLPEVGYTYLLIYLPIALSAPFVGFLNHKINPTLLTSFGILGYGLYTLGMILILNPILFYFWQVLLGISAALFFVSARAILIASGLENPDRAFGWFYSAPFYAEAIAPVVGALFIWKFNFLGVFIFSLAIQFFNAIFCFFQLKKSAIKPLNKYFSFQKFQQNYFQVFKKIKRKNIFLPLLISFLVLLLVGFYRAFFILFLKELGWTQNLILIFGSLLSFLFLPLSLFIINQLAKRKSEKNVFLGSALAGIFSILFGISPFLNFFTILLLMLGNLAGGLIAGSGRSGLISKELKEYSEEVGVIDTIFSPLGTALGALISGLIVGFLGYQLLFILGGAFVIVGGIIAKRFLDNY